MPQMISETYEQRVMGKVFLKECKYGSKERGRDVEQMFIGS